MILEWTHPEILWLAPVAALLLFWTAHHSLAGFTRAQERACLLARATLLACLLLALTGLRWRVRGHNLNVAFLLDQSASIAPEAAAQAEHFIRQSFAARPFGDSAEIIGFATDASILQPLSANGAPQGNWPIPADRERTGTDIGRALDFAAASLPIDAARRVILLSDGNDTADTAQKAALRLNAAGVEVWTVPLRAPEQPEAFVAAVEAPQGLKSGEPFDIRADVRSNVPTPAAVSLFQNGFRVGEQAVALHPGVNEVRFRNVKTSDQLTSYVVELTPEKDTRTENNRGALTVASSGPARVLAISGDPARAEPLIAALRDAKIDVESRDAGGLPRTLEELQPFDLLIFNDVPALRLQRAQMELVQTWVRDFGGGFLMIGGENSFGVGGYFRTPIEQTLPVRMEHDDREDTPSVALLVVLDRSGSMTAPVAGQTKIALADQGAVLALEVLQPHDLFGLDAVDTKVDAVVPLSHPTAKAALEQKILSITAGGGGIYIYTSLADAFRVMREATAKIKHVILFSDAADAEEKAAGEMADGAHGVGNSADVVSAMLAEKITTSVVGLGGEKDKDVPFLRMLAERGNGRFYLTDDALTLPQIFGAETMKVAQSSLIEDPFNAVPSAPSPIIAGIDWATAPPLLGFNSTKIKPTAETLLSTGSGEPLLASWRYGLGQAAAFTSDSEARWAAEWMNWEGYGKFWAAAARGLMRKNGAGGALLQAQAVEVGAGNRLQVTVDAQTPAGGFQDELSVSISAVDAAGGPSQTALAEQIAPGRYRAEFELAPMEAGAPATTMISVTIPGTLDRPYVFGHTRSYSREFLASGVNEPALRDIARLAHGIYDPRPAQTFSPSSEPGWKHIDLTNYFLALSLIILPIDIFLRRRSWA